MLLPEVEINDKGGNKQYLLLLLCATLSTTNTMAIPQIAIGSSALGYLICCFCTYVFLGIPVVYMELIVSQFTGRNCIDIWKIRPCLSHIGFFMFFWQIITLVYNHTKVCLVLHYLFITFESPPPYYVCGPWAGKQCDIIKLNYTLNQNCLRVREPLPICNTLYLTFPEHLYYAKVILGGKTQNFFIAWPVCFSSVFVTIALFLMCFRKMNSLKWFLYSIVVLPILGYMILLAGSMRQKGVIMHYSDSIDSDFSEFGWRSRPAHIILQVLYSLNVGTGVLPTLSSMVPFRSPCYANAVVIVLVSAGFTILGICTTAFMPCPYAYEYGVSPLNIMLMPTSFTFIRVPKMFSEYSYRLFFITIMFSCQRLLGLTKQISIFISLMEILGTKNTKCKKYPAIVALIGSVIIFIVGLPFLGTLGRNIVSSAFIKVLFLDSIFFSIIGNIVFIITYGMERFYEDVHFMQGIQPKTYMKISWICLSLILTVAYCIECAHLTIRTNTEIIAVSLIIATKGAIVFVFIVKIIIAVYKNKIFQHFALDRTWGPRGEVLRRSRAMFTALAMTKEYMYRQYHLQAGILARQQRSNTRSSAAYPMSRFGNSDPIF